jgi:hypothetical protein
MQGPQRNAEGRKLLLEITVCELHCLMVAKAEVGGLAAAQDDSNQKIISNTMQQKIIKKDLPQVKKATDWHKHMCGCEVWSDNRMIKVSKDANESCIKSH